MITVKVGGDRSGASAVLPKQGVTLQLFDNATTTTPTTFVTPNTCVSDVDGDCNWTVINTGDRRRRTTIARFFVRQIGTAGRTPSPTRSSTSGRQRTVDRDHLPVPDLLPAPGWADLQLPGTGVNGFMLEHGRQ